MIPFNRQIGNVAEDNVDEDPCYSVAPFSRPCFQALGDKMLKKFAIALVLALSASQAQAFCIVNRSSETIAFTRGGPFAGMETFYAGTIKPGVQRCTLITPRVDGTYPVSVYTVTKRGKCSVVSGCSYDSRAEQVFFQGTASSSCPIAFQDDSCS